MGLVFEYDDYFNNQFYKNAKIIVFCNPKETLLNNAVSINLKLSKMLISLNRKRRTIRLERLFNSLLDELPDASVIKDFDVLFNPDYKVNIIKMFVEARKRKAFNIIWPGKYEDRKLYYAEDGYEDFKVFNIDDFDITVVI